MSEIKIERDGRVASLILARPDARNAMTAQMGQEIAAAVSELNEDEELRVLLVRGEGKAFAAGGDFSFIEARSKDHPEHNRRIMKSYYQRFLSIRELRMPTIAVLHGAAVGAGLCLALACDIRLAAPGIKLGLNFVRLGLHPGMGATYLLPRLVGAAHAAQLLLTGLPIDAEEGMRIGLINRVYPPEQLLPAAREIAEQIADAAPLAVARAKTSIYRGIERSLESAIEAEAYAQALDFATDDVAEGIRAFYDKRAPVFRGR